MNELLRQAQETLDEVCLNEKAHHVSYERHYLKDLWIGGAAKAVSAIVGAGAFIALVSQLGLDGSKTFSGVPSGYRCLYWIVLSLCVAAPALTAVSLARHDAQDAEAHYRCERTYHELKGELKDLLREYSESEATSDAKQKEAKAANEKFTAIRKRVDGASTIPLFGPAIEEAKNELGEKQNQS